MKMSLDIIFNENASLCDHIRQLSSKMIRNAYKILYIGLISIIY